MCLLQKYYEKVRNSLIFTIIIITYSQGYVKAMKIILYMINKLLTDKQELKIKKNSSRQPIQTRASHGCQHVMACLTG